MARADELEPIREALNLVASSAATREMRAGAVSAIIRLAGGYRWVGIYDVGIHEISVVGWNGPAGPTHPRFPLTQGLNGAAVASQQTVMVNDVSTDSRYLTTLGSTRAELVVPVNVDGRIVGTVDVESASANSFTASDRELVEGVAGTIAPLWQRPIPKGQTRADAVGIASKTSPAASTWSVRRLHALDDAQIDELADLLTDCVEGGASVSFMHPLPHERAVAFWRRVAEGVTTGERALLVAKDAQGICGTVHLVFAHQENQPHRADVSKMLVHRRVRRQGLGAALMRAAESTARECGKTLLVLDTVTGGDAERLYDRLGWERVGVIPGHALMPEGGLCATTVFYRNVG
jgi:putative methionine-R-sulfoxide reductase with GAF domain/GNAT superfamily N-acetyltransferase